MPLELRPLKLDKPPYDFPAAFQTMVQAGGQMVLVLSSPFFVEHLQQEQPTLFGQANLKRTDLGLQSYTAEVGPLASEKDAAAVCRALEAADIQCHG